MTIGTWIGKYAIVRHVLVGGTATVVHFGTYYALTALSVNYNLAFRQNEQGTVLYLATPVIYQQY